LKHYHKNPRQITKKEFADLRDSLRKFGDLSGIVHNLNTDEIISGNQRIEVFDLSQLQIEITERLPAPDEQGTVATGWVVWEGKRYTYRAVMWDEKQSEEANIRANKAGGSWNFDVLANNFNVPDLLEWGFSEIDLGIMPTQDYSELDDKLDKLSGMEEVNIILTVPSRYEKEVKDWLANGEYMTSPGMGKGVLKRCGLL
jgi:hypothetical protein